MDITDENAIFYFSGTGNSLYITKEIATKLRNTKLYSIPQLIGEPLTIHSKVMGIVTPVYQFGLPRVVERFLRQLSCNPSTYCFAIINYGKLAGGAMGDMKEILSEKGIRLNYGERIRMVGNYVIGYDIADPDKQQSLLLSADEKLKQICADIYEREENKVKKGFPGMPKAMREAGNKEVGKTALKFTVGHECNGCGRCRSICSSNNIRFLDGRPVFSDNCQSCLACINWCPRQAIQYLSGEKTRNRRRYHNPRITAKEMFTDTP